MPERGPQGESGASEHRGKAKGGQQHRDNLVIIAGTFGVLIVSYLIYRSSRGGSSSSTTSSAPRLSPGTGTVAGAPAAMSGSAAGPGSPGLDNFAASLEAMLTEQNNANWMANQGLWVKFGELQDQLEQLVANPRGNPTDPTGPRDSVIVGRPVTPPVPWNPSPPELIYVPMFGPDRAPDFPRTVDDGAGSIGAAPPVDIFNPAPANPSYAIPGSGSSRPSWASDIGALTEGQRLEFNTWTAQQQQANPRADISLSAWLRAA